MESTILGLGFRVLGWWGDTSIGDTWRDYAVVSLRAGCARCLGLGIGLVPEIWGCKA